MKEKIKKFIDEFIFNKNIDIENIDKELDKLEIDIDNLYYSINSNTSTYKTRLFFDKYRAITNKYLHFVQNYQKRIKKIYLKKLLYSLLKNYIILGLSILLPVSILSLMLSFVGLYVSYETLINSYELQKVASNKSYKLKKDKDRMKRLSVTLYNSQNALSRSIENITKLEKNEKQETTDIKYANYLILFFIDNDVKTNKTILNTIPENIKILVIKILQDDLKTDEESLETLLEMIYNNTKEMKKEYTQDVLSLKKTK